MFWIKLIRNWSPLIVAVWVLVEQGVVDADDGYIREAGFAVKNNLP